MNKFFGFLLWTAGCFIGGMVTLVCGVVAMAGVIGIEFPEVNIIDHINPKSAYHMVESAVTGKPVVSSPSYVAVPMSTATKTNSTVDNVLENSTGIPLLLNTREEELTDEDIDRLIIAYQTGQSPHFPSDRVLYQYFLKKELELYHANADASRYMVKK